MQLEASLRVFVEHSSWEDAQLRICALQELALLLNEQPLLRAEVLAAREALVAITSSPLLGDVCRLVEAATGDELDSFIPSIHVGGGGYVVNIGCPHLSLISS